LCFDMQPLLINMSLLSQALLEAESGVSALKTRGLKVIRAVVTKGSRLVGKTAAETDFRETYKSAIVAVQQGGKNISQSLSSVKFAVGDVLVLQASDESPLLVRPPEGFYKRDSVMSERPSRSSWSAWSPAGLAVRITWPVQEIQMTLSIALPSRSLLKMTWKMASLLAEMTSMIRNPATVMIPNSRYVLNATNYLRRTSVSNCLESLCFSGARCGRK